MGTRSTILFKDRGENLCKIYQQYDGYIDGVGRELGEFLKGFVIGNGIKMGAKIGEFANGMGCLSAQFIAKFKTECGGLYMTTFDDLEDYNYIVELIEDELQISVYIYENTEPYFKGTLSEFLELKEKGK